MARIRTIKPEFWSDDKVASLTLRSRLVFIGLWNFADDEGRGRCIAKELNGFLFPLDDVPDADIEQCLLELASTGMICIYTVTGRRLFQITHWLKHQAVNRPTPSRHPAPDAPEASVIPQGQLPEASVIPHGQRSDISPVGSRKEEVGSRKVEVGSRKATSSSRSRARRADDPHFERFWSAYPRRLAKADARRAWEKLAPDEITIEAILEGVRRHALSEQWRRDSGQFIPYPATFINKRRWEDDVDQVTLADLPTRTLADTAEDMQRQIERLGIGYGDAR